MTSAKNNGDTGHPCVIPLLRLNNVDIFSFVVINAIIDM